ncbi:Myb-like_DNA-binding domain-containing protein [Hexamita inflata]|uniref:Myb-like DNA-binding domain-containing protein n=1 Tax=Hexamita inflata TaxID=28002 RepID=A0AA86UV95_9EUKA|nr:Myb-like DNA-binding domain-containing protein [Hexamita inflata]
MNRVLKQWSNADKRKLSDLVTQYSLNNRVDWKLISLQFQDRTPTQCKLQYRHVLNKQAPKVNEIWTEERQKQLLALIHIYGKIWKFLQLNQLNPELNPEQLRLKFNQRLNKNKEFKRILVNADNGELINKKQIEAVKFALGRIQHMKQQLADLNQNQTAFITMDPLELKHIKQVEKCLDQFDIQEKERKLQVILKKSTKLM